jgi:hypothetical protein
MLHPNIKLFAKDSSSETRSIDGLRVSPPPPPNPKK